MALTGKKYTRMYSTTGSDSDLISADKVSKIQSIFNSNEYLLDDSALEAHGHLIYQLQQMQDELDYLRTEISSNKDHKTVVGSNTTLSFGDLTATTVKGKTTYSITLTATRDFGGKTGSVTKSTTITLS